MKDIPIFRERLKEESNYESQLVAEMFSVLSEDVSFLNWLLWNVGLHERCR